MAEIQGDVQVLFDNIEESDVTSESATTTDTSGNIDYHQQQYESYVPPHKRGHNVQPGDKFVNHKKNNEQDKQEGVDHDKYQRLMLPVPFALPRAKLAVLKATFPGVFFHCKDNGNHDHPYSHAVTMIGTRFMQRRIKLGSRVLDVYGNPNACTRFNTSQVNAAEPKFMKALVNRCGPADFIREVNKWGPFFDEEEGVERYHRGTLMSMVRAGELKDYDVLQFVHTLYYVPFEELAEALHAPGKRVAYALIHKHASSKGTINDGEQEYTKKFVGGQWLVRQVNKATGSAYVHPDLTGTLFAERKVWMPEGKHAFRGEKEVNPLKGLTWECHLIDDDTWVVEIVPYTEQVDSGIVDYAAMWDDDEYLFDSDPMSTPSESSNEVIQHHDTHVLIPAADGKFFELDIPNRELFSHLRARCAGRDRTPKLLEELISTANHLVNPSTLFGDKVGMRCPPDKIFDVAVAAYYVDIPKEMAISHSVSMLRPVLMKHAKNMKGNSKWKDLCFGDLLSVLRMTLQGVRDVNTVYKSKDPLDIGVAHLQSYLE